jgi:tryptophan synthase alpha chain
MSTIDDLFARLRREGRQAVMPFITAGDPDLAFSAAMLARLADQGAALCELGIPYSDPIADGPVIQASFTRALERRVTLSQILDMAAGAVPQRSMPVVAMVSFAIVHRRGPAQFVADAQRAGLAGAIVPDLLVEEAGELAAVCRRADFSLIHLVAPTTPRERAVRIAESSTGFLYYISVAGTTGARDALPANLVGDLAWLRQRTQLPMCVGFGISRPDQVRQLAPVCDGVIVGSSIVGRMAKLASGKDDEEHRDRVLAEVGQFVAGLVAAAAGDASR